MKLNGSIYPDPEDFEIVPRTSTVARRALSGKVYGFRSEKLDSLVLTFETSIQYANVISSFYEQAAFGLISLSFDRLSSSDISDCSAAFKGEVGLNTDSIIMQVGSKFYRDLTIDLLVHTYETF